MTKTKYQVLARKYRPQTFKEVVGQESIVTTLKNALRFNRVAHAYLFCGSRGVGKTTLARLFAKALNCETRTAELEPCNHCASCQEIGVGQSLDVIEIDGASNRGIDDIRQINETIGYAPSQGRFKIYIIDEVHMLTKEAFNALLKTLEEPPGKVKFFFATTEPHKVLPTIISRCQRFDLGRIPLSQMATKLEQIATDLDRTIEPEAIHLITSFSDGSLRDAESLFDQILCFAEGIVTSDVIRSALGLVSQDYFFKLDQAFSESNIAYAFNLADSLFTTGKDPGHFYEQLMEHVRLLTLAKTMGEGGLELPSDLKAKYLNSAQLYTSAQCLYLLDYLLKTEQQIQRSICQRVSLEAALLHYIQSKNRIPVEILVRKLTELEEKIKMKGIDSVAESRLKISDPIPQKTQTILPEELPPNKNFEPKPAAPTVNSSNFSPVKIEEDELRVDTTLKKESSLSPIIEEVKPEAKDTTLSKNSKPPHHPSHYDTLIRFAAVELEGTVKKP